MQEYGISNRDLLIGGGFLLGLVCLVAVLYAPKRNVRIGQNHGYQLPAMDAEHEVQQQWDDDDAGGEWQSDGGANMYDDSPLQYS
jgi:hypothetical protein